MSVVIETTVGNITVDLFLNDRPRTCMNFIKLCKMKYYNFNLVFSIERDFIAQTGDPTGTGTGGASIFQLIRDDQMRYYEGEKIPIMKHSSVGLISMASCGSGSYGSQFFFTLGNDLDSLDEEHLVFGRVVEGLEVLDILNQTLIDDTKRPYQDILITHTVVLSDPFPDPEGLCYPCESPLPPAELFNSNYIAADEYLKEDELKSLVELQEEMESKEAEARATILEMVGDLPSADMAPPENVLFVCKLNPVTTSEDLEVIFSRFGKIVTAEVICDHVSGNSLQYAFIEFSERKSCEDAYFKMDNVLIDDRRIHVDFSQSVSKIKWKGKGRGVELFDDEGRKLDKENRQSRQVDRFENFNKSKSFDRKTNFNNYKERGSLQRNEREPFQRREREPLERREREPFQRNERESFQRKERESFQRKEREPFQRKDREPFQRKEREPFQRKERESLERKREDDQKPNKKSLRQKRSRSASSTDDSSDSDTEKELRIKSKKERRKIMKKLKKELKKSKKSKKSKKRKSKSKKKKKKESSTSSSSDSSSD